MSDTSIPQGNSSYNEDISVLAAGTNLIGQPCTVWDITVVVEADGDPIVSFANGLTYTNANRKLKVILSTEVKTVHLVFPKGKYFSTGLSATSNLAGVDIAVTYD